MKILGYIIGIGILVILSLWVISIQHHRYTAEIFVNIPDDSLRWRLQREFGKNCRVTDDSCMNSTTRGEMRSLTSFVTSISPLYGDIYDLEGFQYATNLEVLRIVSLIPAGSSGRLAAADGTNGHPVSDSIPLQHLTKLKHLEIAGSGLKGDFTSLANIKSLEILNLQGHKLVDIGFVTSLKKLQSLSLRHNLIQDLQPLEELHNLQDLDLTGNPISNIESLSKLSQLVSLDLSSTQVNNIEPLSDLTQLTNLGLSDTQINNIDLLEEFTQLNNLRLSLTQIDNIEPLKNLVLLEHLEINSTLVSNLTPLEKMTSLKVLNISNTPVTDASSLKNLPLLEEVYAYKTDISANDLKTLKKQGIGVFM